MVFLTGDVHSTYDWGKIDYEMAEGRLQNLTKEDYLIILGDFGFIWNNEPDDFENTWLEKIENLPFSVLFIDGNHENHDRLDAMPVEEWNGGKVHRIRPHILHLMRGQVFTICGKTFFTFGGASCHDIQDGILEPGDPRIREWSYDPFKRFRVRGVSWWERELPSPAEFKEGWKNLATHDNKVDYVLTHCGSNKEVLTMFHGNMKDSDILTSYLDLVLERIEYKRHFFGHYHIDHTDPYLKADILYYDVVQVA